MIEDRLRGQARQHKESVRPDKRGQVEELEERLGAALTTLKSSKLGKGALYQLPWYMIIGPPGSGKTTLLRESSLTFPDQAHGRGVRGVGGTRNCDWWFTDNGILLDTAGRYTTQDEDRNEWFTFLDMLKKSRPQKPVNGAIIAISIADIIQSDEVQLAEHATKIRERVAELTQKLEVIFPIYLLFSKCDLLDGFVETFGGYDKKERAQTWGFATPNEGSKDSQIASQFDAEFTALEERLAAARLRNLAAAKSKHKKAKIFSFPMQFALIRKRLHSFLSQLEQENPYAESSSIRGCYFTSGTQEGQPLDQVLASMREASGLTEELESNVEEAVDTKAYFIDDLFTQVVFPDKDLARSSAKAQKQRNMLRKGGVIASIAAGALAVVALVWSFASHHTQSGRSEEVYKAAFEWQANEESVKDEERLYKGPTGSSFEELRRLFEDLHENYVSITPELMGKSNLIYERRIRQLYVQKLKATFLTPIKERLEQSLVEFVESEGMKDSDVKKWSNRLACYKTLTGKLTLPDPIFINEYLANEDLWVWPGEDRTTEAAKRHLNTFTECVISASNGDWEGDPKSVTIESAQKKVEQGDIVLATFQEVIAEQALDKGAPWSEILENKQATAFLDDGITIKKVFATNANLDESFDRAGQRIDEDNGAEALKELRKTKAIAAWKNKLATMRAPRKVNLEEALRYFEALTDPANSIYLDACDRTAEELNRLLPDDKEIEFDREQLKGVIKQINDLKEPVSEVLSSGLGEYGNRVVADAIDGAAKLNAFVKAAKKVEKDIAAACEKERIDPELGPSLEAALIGSITSLYWALASEIADESKSYWMDSDAKENRGYELAEMSKLFPFVKDFKAEGVDTGRFNAVFKKGGELDKADQWITDLEKVLERIQLGGISPEFTADRDKVDAIQRALFQQGLSAGCAIKVLLERPGNCDATVFTLGDKELVVKRRETEDLPWNSTMSASIELRKYQFLDQKVDTEIAEESSWGFLRLLASGTPSEKPLNYQDNLYNWTEWDQFRHPRTNESLARGDGDQAVKPTAKLHFRTEAKPNPFVPEFFTHTFATEVFRGPNK